MADFVRLEVWVFDPYPESRAPFLAGYYDVIATGYGLALAALPLFDQLVSAHIPAYATALPIVRARAFNHEGPRRGDVFVTSNFARQIAEIEAGGREPTILVGNLKAVRDYTDVRDIVRGYWLLLERGDPGQVYNLCSGRGWAIQEILDFLLGESINTSIRVREDPARLRPSDVPVLIGDCSRLTALGWKPRIPFEQTLRDLLGYWRERARRSGVR